MPLTRILQVGGTKIGRKECRYKYIKISYMIWIMIIIFMTSELYTPGSRFLLE